MTLQDLLVDRYAVLHNLKPRTVELMVYTLDRLQDFLGRPGEVGDLDDLTVSKFVRWRAVTPHRGRLPSPASVRKDLAHIVALANHAARKRLPGRNGQPLEFLDLPRNLVRVPTKPPKAYTSQDVAAMAKAARQRRGHPIGQVPQAWFWESIVLAAWFTGERIGGLLRVRWGDIDIDQKTITFLGENRKGGVETITRPIPESLVQLLVQRKGSHGEYVWPWLAHRSGQDTIYQSLRLLCWRAGVDARGFHGIRKASGSYVFAAGGDATSHLSHADAKTTKRHYLDPKITGQQSALDYLPPLDLDGPDKPAA